jgi:hypothetical protein
MMLFLFVKHYYYLLGKIYCKNLCTNLRGCSNPNRKNQFFQTHAVSGIPVLGYIANGRYYPI